MAVEAVGWLVASVGLLATTKFLTQTHLFNAFLYHRPIPGQVLNTSNGVVFIRDPSLNHPFVWPETVSVGQLTYFAAACGLGVALLEASLAKTVRAIPRAIAMWMVAVTLNELLTNCFKFYCGILRPNFYAGCGFSDVELRCLNPHTDFLHKSFPSGHSSHAWASATMLTWRILASFQQERGGSALTAAAKALLAPLPCAVAGFIACSRVHDNWHHPADVVAGSALGAAIASGVHAFAWPRPEYPHHLLE